MKHVTAIAVVILGIAATANAQTTAAQCSALTKLQVPGFAVEITKTEWIAPGAPAAAAPAAPGAARPANLPAYAASTG